jgi:bifunctional UDP-N-acetylglucosamine pyrophosphorylase/glucosamine-1-phosphate N-acetyltransferase
MVIVLAAGEGKRMKSTTPKVLHELLGRSMVGHVLTAAATLHAARTLVVVGVGAERVADHVAAFGPGVQTVLQPQQRGTGHAVRMAMEAAPDYQGTVLVLSGDTPLLRASTLAALASTHEQRRLAATVMAATVADPAGLGRIVRDESGQLSRIVEERDATEDQRRIAEVNSGIYAFDAAALRSSLANLGTDNDQGEEYLTDAFELLIKGGQRVAVQLAEDPDEALGCNDRIQLAQLAAKLRDRINTDLMRSGVTLLDPATTWIDADVTVGVDAVIEPNTQLRRGTAIGEGARIGPDTTLTNVYVGARATVARTHGTDARIEVGASVGPYAYLRPGTSLGPDGKIGTFVETKNAQIGAGSKVPHLSYVGDATIGEHTNIGAASVFVNYDGVSKNHTVIGSHARTGSDNMFVAPVEVGDGAYTGAGTVVRRNVPPGALSYSYAPQKIVEGWVEARRPGTKSAEAAQAARENEPSE